MRRPSPSGRPSSLSARGSRAALVALVLATVVAGCGSDDGTVTDADLTPGEPIEVSGRAGLVFHNVSTSGTLLFPGGSAGDLPIEPDQRAIEAAADAIKAWLDAVLSERNRGLTTTVAASDVDVAAFATAFGIEAAAPDGALETQVANATYLIEVAYLGQPGWALARVESLLVASDAPAEEVGRRLDTFVFAVDASGAIEFLALEVAP